MLRRVLLCTVLVLHTFHGCARAEAAQAEAVGPQRAANPRPADTELLLVERAYWQRQRVGIAGPIALAAVGAGLMLLGGWMFTLETRYKCGECSPNPVQTYPGPAKAFMIIGASGVVAGSTWLGFRLVKRRTRTRELERIERVLGGLGATTMQLDVLPRAVLSPATGFAQVGFEAVLRF